MEIDERISFGYADAGTVRLHYAKAGKGERLVLLLHGFPEFWYSWRHQVVDLSEKYTVVAPDLRGYNLSDRPKGISNYELSLLSDDIAGLIRHLGRERAAVIGHDWGAGVAWAFAGRHPDLLWKLGALQVPPFSIWKKNLTARQLLASWYMFFFQLPFVPEMVGSFGDFAILERAITNSTAEPNVFTSNEIREYKKAWSQPGALTAMMNYYRANFLQRLLRKGRPSARITAPTLFIYGEKDHAILPSTVEGVSEFVGGPFVEVRIPNSAHWVQQEARIEVTNAIREFLDADI